MVVIKKYWLFLQDLFAAYTQDQQDLDKKPREGQDSLVILTSGLYKSTHHHEIMMPGPIKDL